MTRDRVISPIGFLCIVGPVAEGEGDGGKDLHPVEKELCPGCGIPGQIDREFEKEVAEDEAQNRGEKSTRRRHREALSR